MMLTKFHHCRSTLKAALIRAASASLTAPRPLANQPDLTELTDRRHSSAAIRAAMHVNKKSALSFDWIAPT